MRVGALTIVLLCLSATLVAQDTPPKLRGMESLKAKQFEAAERAFREALEKDPGDSETLFLLARAQFAGGKYREAAGSADRAGASAEHAGPFLLAARCYVRLHEPDKAITELKKAVDFNFGDADFLRKDPDFRTLAGHADFDSILQSAEGNGAQVTPVPIEQRGLAVGEMAPDFSLVDQFGRSRSLRSLGRSAGLILLFIRSADW